MSVCVFFALYLCESRHTAAGNATTALMTLMMMMMFTMMILPTTMTTTATRSDHNDDDDDDDARTTHTFIGISTPFHAQNDAPTTSTSKPHARFLYNYYDSQFRLRAHVALNSTE